MVMVFAGTGVVTVKSKGLLGVFKKDTVLSLSPGSQIRDTANRIVLPSYVAGEYKVRALIDRNGQVHRVWVLTPEELAASEAKK